MYALYLNIYRSHKLDDHIIISMCYSVLGTGGGGGNLLRRYQWRLSLAATSPSFVFANLALFNALDASSCPIQHVPAESARSAGEM